MVRHQWLLGIAVIAGLLAPRAICGDQPQAPAEKVAVQATADDKAADDKAADDKAADDKAADDKAADDKAADDKTEEEKAAMEQAFIDQVSGTIWTGRFTMIEKTLGDTADEQYTIRTVEKVPNSNRFRFMAGIKYGQLDVELPLELPVIWSGKTPVITLDQFTIPGMGTFSARVLIDDGKYAGTWSHDEHGGHLFGTIKKMPADAALNKDAAEKAK
jgi:hypothetical protein